MLITSILALCGCAFLAGSWFGDEMSKESEDYDSVDELSETSHLGSVDSTTSEIIFDATEVDISDLPDATSDWFSNENVEVVDYEDGSQFVIEVSPDFSGDIVVLDANYVEDGGDIATKFTGFNVYLKGSNSTFPDGYSYDENSGTLSKSNDDDSDSEEQPIDKLLLRVETGQLTFQKDLVTGKVTNLFDSRIIDPIFLVR